MAIDASIPLGVQQHQPMQALSGLLNIANTQQSMQARNLQMQQQEQVNQQGAIDLQERQALQPFLSDPKNFTDDSGNVDQNKLYTGIMKLAPTTGTKHIHDIANTQQALTTAKQQIFNLSEAKRAMLGNIFASVDPKDSKLVEKTFEVAKAVNPEAADAIDLGLNMYKNVPAEMRPQIMERIARSVLPQPVQQEMNSPSLVTIDNGQTVSSYNIKPGVQDIPQGSELPSLRTTKQLPVGTKTFNQETNSYGYVEPTTGKEGLDTSKLTPKQIEILVKHDPEAFANGVKHFNSSGGAPTQAEAPIGRSQNIIDNVDQMNKHFAGLQDQAAGNQLVQALTGNIKSLANKSITGTESDRRAYVVGLMNAFGLGGQVTGDLKTDTDLLEKNMAQLNMASPAHSDAARALVSAARPNSHMSPKAISEAADQVAGQVKANVAIRNALENYKRLGDVAGYNSMRQKLENVADPRAWQYEALKPGSAEAKEFLRKLTPEDRETLGKKIQILEQMRMFE